MTQIKTFHNFYIDRLEEEVNRWLRSENSLIHVVDIQIKYCSSTAIKGSFVACVVYEEMV